MDILSVLPVLITVFGIGFIVKLRAFFILHPCRTAKTLAPMLKDQSAFLSLMLSLAGTLGVGNIVGVAYGIAVGGKGMLFWLVISAFFAMAIKYAEATVAADFRENDEGGIFYVIKKSFSKFKNPLSAIYAILIVALSITMGAPLQAGAALDTLSLTEKGEQIASLFFTLAVCFAIFGGKRKIERITGILIPIATIIYIFLTLAVIVPNIKAIPSLLFDIIKDAFNFRAALGGVSAFIFSRGLKEGFLRGLLSNEAGAGTSAIAHSQNKSGSAAAVGVFGITEVFIDTLILCPLTAFAVLLNVKSPESFSGGIEIINAALSSIKAISVPLLSFSVFTFAYSTVICWYYYGISALEFLANTKRALYTVLFIAALLFGSLLPESILILASDYILFFLTLISLFAISKNSDRLVRLSENEGLITKRGYGKEALRKARQESKKAPTRKVRQ